MTTSKEKNGQLTTPYIIYAQIGFSTNRQTINKNIATPEKSPIFTSHKPYTNSLPTIRIIALKIFYFLIFLNGLNLFAQDTIVYQGVLRGDFLIETIELYPDSTFKWTNEYDLTWSEYGQYKISDKKLTLNHYIFSDYPETMSLKDSISTIKKPTKSRTLEIDNNRIFPITEAGNP